MGKLQSTVRLAPHLSRITYHVKYVVTDELGTGIHVKEVRVWQRRRPQKCHSHLSVLVHVVHQ